MSITIKTNNQARPLLYWDELTPAEQKDYDWIEEADTDNFTFFRYKGYCYTTSDFMRVESGGSLELLGWQGYYGTSYFSAILLKYTECGDGVIVATYYS